MMRGGRLLAESAPMSLIQSYERTVSCVVVKLDVSIYFVIKVS